MDPARCASPGRARAEWAAAEPLNTVSVVEGWQAFWNQQQDVVSPAKARL